MTRVSGSGNPVADSVARFKGDRIARIMSSRRNLWTQVPGRIARKSPGGPNEEIARLKLACAFVGVPLD
jgi:hypothetical protein